MTTAKTDTAVNDLGQYASDFADWRRIMSTVQTVEAKTVVFTNLADEAAGYVAKGLPKAAAVDELHEIALAHGLIAAHGEDEVQRLISDAFLSVEEESAILPDDPPVGNGRGGEREPGMKLNRTRTRKRNAEAVPAFSDDALALRFADEHAAHLRFVAAWNCWLRWDGTHWEFDDTLKVFDLARAICRQAANEANSPKVATALASAKTVAAVVSLARSDRRLAATVDQWDADGWLLNTPAGVMDLQTGTLRPHRPEDYLTKLTGVTPDERCSTRLWQDFLETVTAGDKELIAYLQRLCGYCLTGEIREHILAFLYGRGANGKTKFLEAITGCMGDYHRAAPIETFTASNTDRHPTDLAGLRGARLVTAVETEEGRRWAESKIKTLTGGDPISARFMRQDFFEYVPQFKLLIAGNHKPGLRSVDEAIRRRFSLIPFTFTIPPAERDGKFGEKLKAEWPGILAWMIAGCLEWQRGGLNPPEAVTAATAAYLEAQDAVAAWLDDCCDLDPNLWERSMTLFASWKAWAEKAGEHAGNIKTLRDRLEARDVFAKREPGTGRSGYQGIQIKRETGDEPYWTR